MGRTAHLAQKAQRREKRLLARARRKVPSAPPGARYAGYRVVKRLTPWRLVLSIAGGNMFFHDATRAVTVVDAGETPAPRQSVAVESTAARWHG